MSFSGASRSGGGVPLISTEDEEAAN
jgi:hypothetical protein